MESEHPLIEIAYNCGDFRAANFTHFVCDAHQPHPHTHGS